MSWRQKVKKHVIGLMLLFVIFSMTFADDLAKNDYLTISPSIGYYYAVTPEYLFLISTEENYCEECPREYFRLDNDGWFYFSDEYDNVLMIEGYPDAQFYITDSNTWKTGEYEKNRGIYYKEWYGTVYSATSELKEKTKEGTVIYKADNMKKFAYAPGDHHSDFSWNFEGKPWAEGVKGYGIGEKIRISTKEPFHILEILNGYVCPQHTDLYKKNSRVKTFTVKDLDNNLEYVFNLEDAVEFQFFKLRKVTKNVELTIKDVYKGDIWDDTFITTILPDAYSSDWEDKSVPFVQTYTYKCDKKEILDRIEAAKKACEAND